MAKEKDEEPKDEEQEKHEEQIKEFVKELKGESRTLSLQILELLKQGLSEREIGKKLGKSQNTINYWKEKLLRLAPGEFEARKPGRSKKIPETKLVEKEETPEEREERFRKIEEQIQRAGDYWIEEERKLWERKSIFGERYRENEAEIKKQFYQKYLARVKELRAGGVKESEANEIAKKELQPLQEKAIKEAEERKQLYETYLKRVEELIAEGIEANEARTIARKELHL